MRTDLRLILATLIVAAIGVGLSVVTTPLLLGWFSYVPYVAALLALTALSFSYLERSRLPVAHNVAIVGYPKSGKTTLIVSLFGEAFARRILPSISVSPKAS